MPTEEEYLRKHLEGLGGSNNTEDQQKNKKVNIQSDNTKFSDLQYFAFDTKEFPCGIFYPAGSTIQVRAAEVREIQAYSMVDDNNIYDIIDKMNDIISSCVRIKYIDGTIGTYLEIKDPDRFYIIFLIRELTFQKGSSLTTETIRCACNSEEKIELKRENFQIYKTPEKLIKFYDPSTLSFRFKLKNGLTYNLAPPTIGLQKSFTEYIIKENANNRKANLSFLKIIPFLLCDRNNITLEGIESKLGEYDKMDDTSFQFLNDAVGKMIFGIDKIRKNCKECGGEVRTDMMFPNGASGIFLIHDAFDQFIEE
jgi:uncharacterized protein YqgV (UPF0045/DUF77 family)